MSAHETLTATQRRWLAWYVERASSNADLLSGEDMGKLLAILVGRGEPLARDGRKGRRGREDNEALFAWARAFMPGFVRRRVPAAELRAIVCVWLAREAADAGPTGARHEVLRRADGRVRFVWTITDRAATTSTPTTEDETRERRALAFEAAIDALRRYVRARNATAGAAAHERALKAAARAVKAAARTFGMVGELPQELDFARAFARSDADAMRRTRRGDPWEHAVLVATERHAREAACRADVARLVLEELLGASPR